MSAPVCLNDKNATLLESATQQNLSSMCPSTSSTYFGRNVDDMSEKKSPKAQDVQNFVAQNPISTTNPTPEVVLTHSVKDPEVMELQVNIDTFSNSFSNKLINYKIIQSPENNVFGLKINTDNNPCCIFRFDINDGGIEGFFLHNFKKSGNYFVKVVRSKYSLPYLEIKLGDKIEKEEFCFKTLSHTGPFSDSYSDIIGSD